MENINTTENTNETKREYISHPSMIRYLRNRYKNDEEYRNKQIEHGKLTYQINKEYILSRYKNEEDFRKRKSQYSKKWYQKVKAKKEAEKKAKEEAEELGGHIMDIS